MPETLGVALDPFRPTELVTAPGVLPECCPLCKGRLQDVRRNDKDDILFECLNEGYEAVYRTTPDDCQPRMVNGIAVQGPWEPYARPGMASEGWRPPVSNRAVEAPPAARAPRARRATSPTSRAAVSTETGSTAAMPPSPPPPSEAAAPEDLAWVTLADAADLTGATPNAIYLRVKRQTLDAKRGPDGKVLVRADQLAGDGDPT